jgi:DnaJ-class molecular chaperone
MSEPLWCDIRQHYCRCHDYGKRCDDFDDEPAYCEACGGKGQKMDGHPCADCGGTGRL